MLQALFDFIDGLPYGEVRRYRAALEKIARRDKTVAIEPLLKTKIGKYTTSISHYATENSFNIALTDFLFNLDAIVREEKTQIRWNEHQLNLLREIQSIVSLRKVVYFHTNDKHFNSMLDKVIKDTQQLHEDHSNDTTPEAEDWVEVPPGHVAHIDSINQIINNTIQSAETHEAINSEDPNFIEPLSPAIRAEATRELDLKEENSNATIGEIMRLIQLKIDKLSRHLTSLPSIKHNNITQEKLYGYLKNNTQNGLKGHDQNLGKKYIALHDFYDYLNSINENKQTSFFNKLETIHAHYRDNKISETLQLRHTSRIATFFKKIGRLFTKPFKQGKRIFSGRFFENQHQRLDRQIQEKLNPEVKGATSSPTTKK